ncbi:uncharacterized protein LOC105008160 [Esox lucius]|uniref:uncharacterized protein LOC105008160 n=1 Tax=Esox lucius TaxID=8010 RepID=UPI000576FDB3|nr:uncharacterized protein LOC105008160 [Esox lucius]
MEDTVKKEPKNAQVLSLGRKDTRRLLDVYVRRSISLNDGTCEDQIKKNKPRKWVTLSMKHRTVSRPMSDTSLTLGPSTPHKDSPSSTQPDRKVPNVAPRTISGPVAITEIETFTETENKSKEHKKRSKRSYLWKNFLGFFSKKGSDKKDEQDSRTEKHGQSQGTEKKKSIKLRNSTKKLSIIKSKIDRVSVRRRSQARDRTNTDITGVESVLSVVPTDSYYEKVSEELEKIVHEVKEIGTPLPDAVLCVEPTDSYYEKVSEELEKIVHEVKEKPTPVTEEEVIKRIIVLIKQHGDEIDSKLKESPSLSSFFQKLSYNTFMQLADTYVETKTPIVPKHQTPHCADNAPELVKLAFTMDFTARMACLSRHSTSHIMGLGHRYLEDRFTQTQPTTPETVCSNVFN